MAKPLPHFARLDAGEIITTADRLARRIDERFHGSGLSSVAATLVELGRSTAQEVLVLDKPNIPIRIGVGAVLVAGIVGLIAVGSLVAYGRVEGGVISLLQGLESAMNIAILVGLGVVGLTRLESTWKRRRAMTSLHTLRSLAHVIDMHQLTKDPKPTLDETDATPNSPKRELEPERSRTLSRLLLRNALIAWKARGAPRAEPSGYADRANGERDRSADNESGSKDLAEDRDHRGEPATR